MGKKFGNNSKFCWVHSEGDYYEGERLVYS